jgi:CBS domain containing-hemolysin-like protein
MTADLTIFILAVTMALTVSFLCSLFESVLLSVSTTDIAEISQKNPAAGRAWQSFKENISKPISAILILNTLAHTIGASVAGSKFPAIFGPKYIAVFSIVFSFAMIQWTEILPKTIGVRLKQRFALALAVPLGVLIRVMAPLVGLVRLLNRPFEGRKAEKKNVDASNEINILARFAALNREINEDQGRIIAQSMALSKTRVADIMIPRGEIRTFSTKMNLAEALVEAHIVHHTRFPLAEDGDPDRIIGYVNFKDIVSALQINPRDPTLRGILRPIIEVKPADSLTSLLTRLTRSYQHIAVVRSDAGRTEGLVTLEDLIEFMVGKLQDEYDFLPQHCYQIADNRYIVGGGATLNYLRGKCGEAFLPALERSLHDWLSEKFGSTPTPERKHREGSTVFTVRKIRNGRIHEVIVDHIQDPA